MAVSALQGREIIRIMVYNNIGNKLVAMGCITEAQLASAQRRQASHPEQRLIDIVVDRGYADAADVYRVLGEELGVEFVDLLTKEVPRELAKLLPQNIAKKHNVVPVRKTGDTLFVATTDPLNFIATDAVRLATRNKVEPLLATPAGIERMLSFFYDPQSAEKALQDLTGLHEEEDANDRDLMEEVGEDAAPTIRLVSSFLDYAVNQNVSDIHLEPRENYMAVRMRIDGVLRHTFTVPTATQAAVVARIKVMGNMNIAERRVPQDGRSFVRVGEREIDLRISTLPTIYGEKVVIRLLDKSESLMNKTGIGLSGSNMDKFNALLENSNGVILLVGPTGSGKSTTMYTMIGNLNTEDVNLVTLEDPVEYNFDGVNQVQINEKTGMTFASGLRSILRQDPDIIAVGEIRDGETADIAMRAAITGHLVLSTLHTNDAPSAIDRLVDMGVEPFLIASALKGVISQRLVRRICSNCREAYEPDADEVRKLRLPTEEKHTFFRGKGCPACFNTGYRGRTAVFEILTVNADIRRAVSDRAPYSELEAAVMASNFSPLMEDCVRLVKKGVTTAREALRTVNSTSI